MIDSTVKYLHEYCDFNRGYKKTENDRKNFRYRYMYDYDDDENIHHFLVG